MRIMVVHFTADVDGLIGARRRRATEHALVDGLGRQRRKRATEHSLARTRLFACGTAGQFAHRLDDRLQFALCRLGSLDEQRANLIEVLDRLDEIVPGIDNRRVEMLHRDVGGSTRLRLRLETPLQPSQSLHDRIPSFDFCFPSPSTKHPRLPHLHGTPKGPSAV